MKQCPSCHKTYPDDAPDYCSNDGMRLLSEEAAAYDPEKTMMSSGQRVNEPLPQTPPSATLPEKQYQDAPPSVPPPQMQSQPQSDQQQPQSGIQYAPQGWSPPQPVAQQPYAPQSHTQQPQAAPIWGSPNPQSPPDAPYGSPYVTAPSGRSRAIAIAALVFGTNAITIMSMLVRPTLPFIFNAMLVLSILGIGLGVYALILSLQKPARFGGIPLAIAGLATGTAALVYYFVR
jgi:hypothetical protein